MGNLLSSVKAAVSGMESQASRLRHVSENIANTDTPGYRRKIVAFEQVMQDAQPTGLVKTGPVMLDQTAQPKIYDPTHPMADENGYYDGSNVKLVVEMADAREAQRSYDANLKMFEQAREMSKSLLELLRK